MSFSMLMELQYANEQVSSNHAPPHGKITDCHLSYYPIHDFLLLCYSGGEIPCLRIMTKCAIRKTRVNSGRNKTCKV